MDGPSLGAAVLAFAGIALAVTLMPGADTVLVLRTSLRDGWRPGVVTALGVVCGPIVWGGLAGLGVALLLSRSPLAYDLVAAAGGLYLVHLAVRAFLSARALWRSEAETDLTAPVVPRGRTSGYFLTGLMTNLLNPKIGVFYLSVMPGLLIGQEITVWLGALLGAIHSVLGLVFLSLVALLADRARRYLVRPRVNAVIEAVCGLCLLAFGVVVLVEVAIRLR